MDNLTRERQSYLIPGVSSAVCFRTMYESIGNSTGSSELFLALEWLDTTLAEVKYQPDMRIYALISTFLRAALTSCVVLDNQQYVNTGTIPGLEESESANQSRLQACQYLAFRRRDWPRHRQSRRFGTR
jgi:hypothetical protein